MILPLVGELAALIGKQLFHVISFKCEINSKLRILVYLIAAVFMKQLPLEFSSILGKLLPAITGGYNLMLMAVYSYLTELTTEKDRTFR